MNKEEKENLAKQSIIAHGLRSLGIDVQMQSTHGCNNRTNYIGSASTTMAMSAAEFRSEILTSGSSSRQLLTARGLFFSSSDGNFAKLLDYSKLKSISD